MNLLYMLCVPIGYGGVMDAVQGEWAHGDRWQGVVPLPQGEVGLEVLSGPSFITVVAQKK